MSRMPPQETAIPKEWRQFCSLCGPDVTITKKSWSGPSRQISAKMCGEIAQSTSNKSDSSSKVTHLSEGTPQEALMSNLQAFLLGMMIAWSPTLIVLGC